MFNERKGGNNATNISLGCFPVFSAMGFGCPLLVSLCDGGMVSRHGCTCKAEEPVLSVWITIGTHGGADEVTVGVESVGKRRVFARELAYHVFRLPAWEP